MFRASFRAAFTLVELLVVIGIIALLIAVLLPALAKARKSAQEIVCASNLRQWGIGIQIYADQAKGELPQKGPDGTGVNSASSNYFGSPTSGVTGYDDPSIWFNAIPPLVNGKTYFQQLWDDFKGNQSLAKEGDKSIFICPSAGPSYGYRDTMANGYFLLHGDETASNPQQILAGGLIPAHFFKFASSYVFNSKLTNTFLDQNDHPVKMSQCRPTSQVVMMTEKMNNAGEYKIRDVQQYAAAYPTSYFSSNVGYEITANGDVNNLGQSKADWRRFTTRHRNGGFLLYADGHVAWSSWLEAQIQPSEMPYRPNISDANQPSTMVWSVVGPIQ